ncbi:MAG TPA: His/Gly/Thr/Pro-type tRNA ligase C-terminal domain-containing protein, partial [Dehalococcoidia bacterium]|nr:His/Gly/Thr/Pro-type tRNA ligase C-terminal domain-containing protein [Dehalococcoidia bacterium]
RALRDEGFRVLLDAGERKLDRKLRSADRIGAGVAVLVGEDEVARDEVTVRDLRRRSQQRVSRGELAGLLQRMLEGAS